jgi:hypothetical protein
VLERAFSEVQAVVVLLTPDDYAYLRPELQSIDDREWEREPTGQARPNVLFEAGMAFQKDSNRTVLVEIGKLRPFSNVEGRHVVKLDNSPEKRQEFAQRLKTAGCDVDTSGSDWLRVGNLAPPILTPAIPMGSRLVELPVAKAKALVDITFQNEGKGNGKLAIINRGQVDVYKVTIEVPEETTGLQVFSDRSPIPVLPRGKTVRLPAFRMPKGGGPPKTHGFLIVRGEFEDGEEYVETVFVDYS